MGSLIPLLLAGGLKDFLWGREFFGADQERLGLVGGWRLPEDGYQFTAVGNYCKVVGCMPAA